MFRSLAQKSNTLIIAASIAAILLMGIIIAGLSARPIADDLAYLQVYSHHNSVIGSALDQYFNHSGRLSQVTLVYVFYALFGDIATRVAPLVLLVVLSISFALLIYLLLRSQKDRLTVSIIGGVLLSSSALITMPSLFDSLYWLTSSTVYVTSLIGLVLTASLIVSIFKYKTWKRPVKLLLILPLIILMQSFGEAGAVVSIAISGLATAWVLIDATKRHLTIQNLIVFFGLMAGFLINFLSPATRNRQSINEGSQSVSDLINHTLSPLSTMFNLMEWWHIALAIMVAVIMFIITPKGQQYISKKQSVTAILAVLVGLFMVLVITFGISAISVGQYFAIRNFTVPHTALFIAMVLIILVILRSINTRTKGLVYKISPILLIVATLTSVPFAINKQAIYIRAMATRDSFYSQREISIKRQLENDTPIVQAQPVQVIVSPSEAADLQNPDLPQVDWVVRMIESHYNIPNFKISQSPVTYCVPNSKYIRHDHGCDYTYNIDD